MFTNAESLLTFALLVCLVVLAGGCGLCVWLIGWKGRAAGLTLGGIVLAGGLLVLGVTLATIERYWWIALPPMLLGIQSMRVWRQTQHKPGMALSSWLLFLGFMAAMFAGASHIYRQVHAERSIIATIESRVDGEVQRDFDGLAVGVVVYEVDTALLDEILPLLGQLPYLQRLQLDHCSISDSQAKRIGGLRNLRQLWLQATDVDDEKVAELARLTYLEDLDLMDTPITGRGLQQLWGARRLRHIWLSSDKITVDDIAQLQAHLPKLEVSY